MTSKLHLISAIVGIPVLFTALQSCVVETRAPLQPTVHTTTYAPGHVVTTLPAGYTTVRRAGARYYVADGVYYQPRGTQYVVVRSPY